MFPYGSTEWLDELRLLLCFGFAASTLLWVVLNWPNDRKRPSVTASDPVCKLHQRSESQCRDMHDE